MKIQMNRKRFEWLLIEVAGRDYGRSAAEAVARAKEVIELAATTADGLEAEGGFVKGEVPVSRVSNDEIAKMVGQGIMASEAARQLMERFKYARPAAYRVIKRAIDHKAIQRIGDVLRPKDWNPDAVPHGTPESSSTAVSPDGTSAAPQPGGFPEV